MGRQTFPGWFAAPDQQWQTAIVDGSEVGATPGSTGLDTRGKFFCQISKSTNRITVDYINGYALPPIVIFTGITANLGFNIISQTSKQLVFDTVERDDNTTGINDADYMMTFLTDKSNKAYS